LVIRLALSNLALQLHYMNETNPSISFENTEIAFAPKSNANLKKAHFLFSSMGKPWLVNFGLKFMPLAIKWHLPFTKTIIRNTIFQQFVGGETLQETAPVAQKLAQHNVEVILDYGVEGGEDNEQEFNHAANEFIKVINYAATQPNIPFMSIKVTGFARFSLLEKIDAEMQKAEGTLMKRYLQVTEQLNIDEKIEWHNVRTRLLRICESGAQKNIGVLVDAEETWIQDPVDALTILMMDTFNKNKAIVFNTMQLYRHDRLAFLKECHSATLERGFILGAKLVRGAYMEKERKRAAELNYPSPIQPNKESTDKDYNEAVEFCITHLSRISTIVASHNEYSNLLATQLLQKNNLSLKDKHIHFSQLYGMSDNITFNLAQAGCSVSKYLPFGPIKDVIPYLMRRAQENSSVAGQTGRELGLIKKEMARRDVRKIT
jgi:proline dehydrogenase